MAQFFDEIVFHPNVDELVPSSAQGKRVIFTGGNNSGKSAYLKKAIEDPRKLYIGVNRFYSFHHLGFYTKNESEINDWFHNMQHSSRNVQYQNFEESFFNCSTAISRLSNARRKILFDEFENLFGTKVEVLSEDPKNEFSQKFISVGGDSLSVTSSGTRLFLGILAALMDDRFFTVAIDEPELGLSPVLQRKLADIMIRGERNKELFPHNPNIVISTHSHLFLDRDCYHNNYVVSKNQDNISAIQCSGFHELHDIQFRLLGNDLSHLFLPDAVVFVEGETDQIYLESIVKLLCPTLRVVIQACGGDIARRLAYWATSLGDLQLSPYRTRTLVVYDSVKQAGIERACANAGLPKSSLIEWDSNGIEYLYPDEALRQIFRDQDLSANSLEIQSDRVSHKGISYTKMELCRLVCAELNRETCLPKELEDKFLKPLMAIK
jgi:predicted ATPase